MQHWIANLKEIQGFDCCGCELSRRNHSSGVQWVAVLPVLSPIQGEIFSNLTLAGDLFDLCLRKYWQGTSREHVYGVAL